MGRPKKNLHEQATEPRILQAAEAEFGRAGFSAARLEDIAHTAQIQRSSLLYHFASKEELYAAVVRGAFGQLEGMLVEGISAEGSFEERLDLVLENFLSFLDTRHAQPARAQVVGFGHLHEAEEVAEVHDPGHVGVAELDAAGGGERRHSNHFP